jgi:hypothetical protein
MDDHKSSRDYVAPVALVNLILDLLRMKRFRSDPEGTTYTIDCDREGWMPCDYIIDIVRDEIPGSQFNHPRLISIVRNDRYRRMQLFTQEFDHVMRSDDITHIRACSGHDPALGIVESQLFKPRQRLSVNRHGEYRPDQHSGPRYAFYYTDIAGLMEIWRTNGVTPSSVKYGVRSKIYVYLAPTTRDDPDCPEACKAHSDQNNVQITIDLGLIMHDKFPCFYTDDGFIAIRTDVIPMAFCCQIICAKTGAYYFVRPFEISSGHWASVSSRPNDTSNTMSVRDIKQEECYVCGTNMWIGVVTCFQCGNPIIHNDVVPDLDPKITGLPASSITEIPRDTLFTFRNRMAEGRKARGIQFNMTYRVRLPAGTFSANTWRTGRRSYAQQAARWDKHLEVIHKKKLDAGDVSEERIEDTIRNNREFRMHLALMIVRCNQNFAPAQVYRSKYCRSAFEKAVELGEISKENIGKRTRVNEAEMDES